MKHYLPRLKYIKGFTLVELAIVLMIIGLLIGGILKGQELINNARIIKTVRQFQAYQTAVTTFRSMYDALPGDIANPSSRIPDCAAALCNIPGNNDGMLDALAEERRTFWIHLAKSNLVSDIDLSSNAPASLYPKTPFGGNILVYYHGTVPNFGGTFPNSNVFLPYGTNVNHGKLLSFQVAKIDTKMDDGRPSTGIFLSRNDNETTETCLTGSAYNEAAGNALCYSVILFN